MQATAHQVRRFVRPGLALLACSVVLAGCGASAKIPPPLARAAMEAELKTPVASTTPSERATTLAVPKAVRTLESKAGTVFPDPPSQAKAVLARELAALRGTPVVVNLWGEWCHPCVRETPVLQRTALALRGKVAFLGVATFSNRSLTDKFLNNKLWLPYPSILDDDGQIIATSGLKEPPQTFFYSPTGKRFVHLGGYTSVAEFEADIKRYTA